MLLHITLSTGHVIVATEFEFINENEVRITENESKQVMFEICMSIKGSKYNSTLNEFICNFDECIQIKNVE